MPEGVEAWARRNGCLLCCLIPVLLTAGILGGTGRITLGDWIHPLRSPSPRPPQLCSWPPHAAPPADRLRLRREHHRARNRLTRHDSREIDPVVRRGHLRRNRWGLADLARSSGTPRPAVDRRRCHRSRSVRVRRHPATRRQLRAHPRRLRRHLRRRIPRLGRRRRQIPARPLGHHRSSDLPCRRCRDHVRPTSSRILNRGVITKRSCRHHANRQSREQRSLTVVRRVRAAVAG